MANKETRKLTLKFDGDSSGLASASKSAGATLEKFNKSTERTASKVERVTEKSDGMADSSSKATGALGALASGFELVGLEGYASGLQSAALATDFLSGVGDSLSLVTGKLTFLTKAQTVAQRALNAVMRANPIGILITLGLLLAGLFAVLWKRSDKFRTIVTKAFGGVQKAAAKAWGWIKDKWPLLLAIITGPIGIAVLLITRNWDKIKSGAKAAKDFVTDKFDAVVRFVRRLPGRIGSAASGMWDGIKDAFRSALNWIIEKWNGLEFKIPSVDTKIPGLGKVGGFTLGTPNIGRLAAGGYGIPGRTYLTGEYGPELITFGSGGGVVTPNNRLGGGTPEVHVYIGDRELRDVVRVEVRESNRDTRRRAGQLAGAL